MIGQSVLRSFSNVGHLDHARRFAGFSNASGVRRLELQPRGALHVSLRSGDLLRFPAVLDPTRICLAAFDDRGARTEAVIGLRATGHVAYRDFDCDQLVGWLVGHGATLSEDLSVASLELAD